MTDHISLSWIFKAFNWFLNPLYQFYSNQPRLYIYTDRVRKTIIPIVPNEFDQVKWTGELIIKNNSKFDSYNLEFYYPEKSKLFDSISEIPKHSHLASNSELRLTFTWVRQYVHATEGLKIRLGHGADHKYPKDKEHLNFIFKYENEKGKYFYSLFERKNKIETVKLFVLRPKLKNKSD